MKMGIFLTNATFHFSTLGCNGYPQRIHVCLTCNKNFQGISVEARNLLSEMKDVISRFIALLPSPVVAVRRNIAASLGSLVLHLPSMYKPDTVNALMKYAEYVQFLYFSNFVQNVSKTGILKFIFSEMKTTKSD